MSLSESGSSCSEVCVWAGCRPLWVSGVSRETTCRQLVQALRAAGACGNRPATSWRITERWRSVEQTLPPSAAVLDIWRAWGDAQHEMRFTLRPASSSSSGDSGRGSPDEGADLRLLKQQADLLTLQANQLRERDDQIVHYEEEIHRSRMETDGPDYLLQCYLRDTTEYGGGGAGGSGGSGGDSGVSARRGRSSRARRLLREHQLTRTLTDICRAAPPQPPQPLLPRLRAEIELLEKLAIVNKRLQREEELLVRLGARLRRRLQQGEDDQHSVCARQLEDLRARMQISSQQLEQVAAELEHADDQLRERQHLLHSLTQQLAAEEQDNSGCHDDDEANNSFTALLDTLV